TPSWIRRVFSPTPRTCRRARARVRPAVESLEERLVPAGFMVTTLADDGSVDSLRWCIDGANQRWNNQKEVSTITIPSSIYVPGENAVSGEPFSTIQLNGTQLPTIVGQLTIVGDQTLNGFFLPAWYISGEEQSRLFQVASGGNLTLEN